MNIRAVGVSAGFATLNAVMILIVQVAPIAMEAISWRFYLIFIVCDVIFVAVVYFAFPETANVSALRRFCFHFVLTNSIGASRGSRQAIWR